MRIVQLTDIHLSISNQDSLVNYYLKSLTDDLQKFHNQTPIDIILITGDLVDKGGHSLGSNPYKVFEQKFISPIIKALNIKSEQILFIPGNHDIDTNKIDEATEFFLANTLTKEKANEKLKEQENKFTQANKRLEKFKNFEKKFHNDNANYQFTLNESLAIIKYKNKSIGFALINDSWRCSPSLTPKSHYIGVNQLYKAKIYFEEQNTSFNIAVFHHPLELINESERDEINSILKTKTFGVAFFGHKHEHKYESIISSGGGMTVIYGRSAFNNSDEKEYKYQPGYNIFDLDLESKFYTLHARKFIKSGLRFDRDVDSLEDGQISGTLSSTPYVNISTSNIAKSIIDKNSTLPNGYSADVDKIVYLLIGKSLYPQPNIFIRELIQNSVDANNRIKEKHPELNPAIVINVNNRENYFEIKDEGDGMSKRVLNEHFSVIGKSISHEFADSINKTNLISQFGIGFISTFIVARKILVCTKSEEDGFVSFEIENVFKGFNYDISIPQDISLGSTGTLIRVYLKSDFSMQKFIYDTTTYCRHVKNLHLYFDGVKHNNSESWNIQGGMFTIHDKTSEYEYKLTIGHSSTNIVTSNSGFLIANRSPEIIPNKFPVIIGGEIMFEPKVIDLDLSRTKIMETEKCTKIKNIISSSLKNLFSKVLENPSHQLAPTVMNYLQFYLVNYDSMQSEIRENYTIFYTKEELISICSALTNIAYKNVYIPIAFALKTSAIIGNCKVYYYNNGTPSESEIVVSNTLIGKGFIVIKSFQSSVHFNKEGQHTYQFFQLIEIIAKYYGFEFIEINSIVPEEISKMKINQSDLPNSINEILNTIKKKNNFNIEVAKFGSAFKQVFHFNGIYYVNFDHKSFQDLILNIERFSRYDLEIYFLGLIGIDLSSASIFEISNN